MRFRLTDPASPNYLHPEAFLNNIKLLSVNSGTELVVAMGITDAAGNLVTTLPVSLASLPALIAGTAKVGATYDTSGQVVDQDGTVRTIQRAFVDATGAGNTEVVAAQGGSVRIRVLSYYMVGTLGVTVKFQSATTNISPGLPIGANGGISCPYNPHGWFQTAANEALNINLGIGTAVGCMVVWIPTL